MNNSIYEKKGLYSDVGQAVYWSTLVISSAFCLSYSFGYHLLGPITNLFTPKPQFSSEVVAINNAPLEKEIVNPVVTYDEKGNMILVPPKGYELRVLENGKVECYKEYIAEENIGVFEVVRDSAGNIIDDGGLSSFDDYIILEEHPQGMVR